MSELSRRDFLRGAAGFTGAATIGALAGSVGTNNVTPALADTESKLPKYVFLFIGDGMSYPQVQATSYYNGALTSDSEPAIDRIGFMDFPVIGSQYTYDSTSFCPDSASTATSIASGNKTNSGVINVSPDGNTTFETIAEKLKAQKDWKVGIITSVNLNHATPAAFYAHQASRKNMYEIGGELIQSGFDYFAGGALLDPQGKEGDQEDLYALAEQAGYTVAKTYDEANALTAGAGKAIIISEVLADEDALSYALDAADTEWQLRDYVAKGIELMQDSPEGFFMMCEGGKIDWACHANDCAAMIHDVMALEESVAVALDFYEQHPDETLIVVTGDHETGGLTIGYAETNYDTFLSNIANQKISYAKFDSDYVKKYVEEQTPFESVLETVTELFGLVPPTGEEAEQEAGSLVLTEFELEQLREAYDRTCSIGTGEQDAMTQEEYVHYGTYQPFTVTLTHLLNHKSGIDFATYSHSGLTVPVFAQGAGADVFDGYYDNTNIYNKLATLTGVA